MKTYLKLAAVAAALAATAAPAFAEAQLIANGGLSPAEAQGLSLNEIAVAKFNRNAGNDDYQAVVTPGFRGDAAQLAASAGLDPAEARGLSLNAVAVAKFNRNADHETRQYPVRGSGVTAISRSAGGAAHAQLAANGGLSADEAGTMSLTEIAVAKFNRNADNDSRQGW